MGKLFFRSEDSNLSIEEWKSKQNPLLVTFQWTTNCFQYGKAEQGGETIQSNEWQKSNKHLRIWEQNKCWDVSPFDIGPSTDRTHWSFEIIIIEHSTVKTKIISSYSDHSSPFSQQDFENEIKNDYTSKRITRSHS